MQARHGQKAAERAGRERTEPPERDDREPVQVVRDAFGDHISWERTFRHMKGHDGETIYADEATGQMYASLPNLHPQDGTPVR